MARFQRKIAGSENRHERLETSFQAESLVRFHLEAGVRSYLHRPRAHSYFSNFGNRRDRRPLDFSRPRDLPPATRGTAWQTIYDL